MFGNEVNAARDYDFFPSSEWALACAHLITRIFSRPFPRSPGSRRYPRTIWGSREGPGDARFAILEKIRAHYPIVLHGVSLSLGSTDPVEHGLSRMASSHFARESSPSGFPIIFAGPASTATIFTIFSLCRTPKKPFATSFPESSGSRIFLAAGSLLENVSSYLTFEHSEMPEWDFLREIAERADCGILLDINNIYVSSVNHRFDPYLYLEGIPGSRIGQFHLAGHQNHGRPSHRYARPPGLRRGLEIIRRSRQAVRRDQHAFGMGRSHP